MRWLVTAVLALAPCSLWGQRMLSAGPFRPDADGYGEVTLRWSTYDGRVAQVRIGSPEGEVFATGGPTGTAQTGRWVREGTRFFLQDISAREPGTTVASLTVRAAANAHPRFVRYIAVSTTSLNS